MLTGTSNGLKQGGFTVIELMMTLLIASVLMAVVAPGMLTLLERNRLQTAAEHLFTSLMLTRSEALKQNRPAIMCKSADGTSCATVGVEWEQGWLVFVDADGDGAPDPDEILRVGGAIGNGVTLRMDGDFDDEISYSTDGTASGAGTFVLCNSDGELQSAREVDVTLTGRPKMNLSTANCSPS